MEEFKVHHEEQSNHNGVVSALQEKQVESQQEIPRLKVESKSLQEEVM